MPGRFLSRVGPSLIRGLIAFVVLGASVALFGVLVSTRPVPERHEVQTRPLAVRVVRLQPRTVATSWPAHGTVRAMRSAEVPAQVSARVIDRPSGIEDGVRVSRGQLILALDPSDFDDRVRGIEQTIRAIDAQIAALDVERWGLESRAAMAEDETELARAELVRARDAVAGGGGNQADIDRAEASLSRVRREAVALNQSLRALGPRLEQLRAQRAAEERNLSLARADLDRTRIVAPIEGYLQTVGADVGEWVASSRVVARIVAIDRLEVPLEVPVSAARSLRVGDVASIRADSAGFSTFEARVTRIAPEARAESRSMLAYVEIEQALDAQHASPTPADDARGLLLPGQYVTGRITTSEPRERLIVPRRAIVEDHVFVAESLATDGGESVVARRTPIIVAEHIEGAFPEIDPAETQWAVIESGLRAGDRVIVSSLDELRDGVAIEAIDLSVTQGAGGGP